GAQAGKASVLRPRNVRGKAHPASERLRVTERAQVDRAVGRFAGRLLEEGEPEILPMGDLLGRREREPGPDVEAAAREGGGEQRVETLERAAEPFRGIE